jgi:hypothetical protein
LPALSVKGLIILHRPKGPVEYLPSRNGFLGGHSRKNDDRTSSLGWEAKFFKEILSMINYSGKACLLKGGGFWQEFEKNALGKNAKAILKNK